MRLSKKFFISFLIFIILISAGIYIFIKTADIQKYKNQVVAKLSKQLGRDIGVGDIRLNFSFEKGLSIDIKDSFISANPAFDTVPIVKIEGIFLGLDIKKLIFEWQIIISKIEVTRPQINLVRRKDGKINFQDLLMGGQEENISEEQAVPKKKPVDLQAYIPFRVQLAEASEKPRSMNMVIQDFDIINASISIKDYTGVEPIILDGNNINFQITNFALEKYFSFKLNASFLSDVQNIAVEGQMRLSAQNHQVRMDNFFIRTDLSNLSIEKINKAFPEFKSMGIENNLYGKIYLDGIRLITNQEGLKDLKLTGHLIDAKMKLTSMLYPIENMDIDFTLTESDINFSDIFMYVASGRVTGKLKLEDYLNKQRFSGNIDVENIQLDEIISDKDLPVKMKGSLYARVIAKGQGLSKSLLRKNMQADIVMDIKDGKIVDVNILKIVLSNISMLPKLVETIQLNLPEKYKESLRVKDTVIDKAQLEAGLKKGILKFDRAEVEAQGFSASVKGQVDWKQNLDAFIDFFIAKDLSASMIKDVEQLKELLNDKQQIRIPLREYHGKLENFKTYPDLEDLAKKIIINTGKQELKKALFKALDIEKAQPSTEEEKKLNSETSDTPATEDQQRPEEILIDTIFNAIFD